ncbi:hypothetical protein GCM10007989_26150 [Devosia pacifica]|uniref:Head-tail adaptor protein n=1 Tax=Devosia pacifica TaxID=1335967 RepID=A0A918S9Z3_9HYPH|nr:phage head closure protein [Devosia pacifica]GHA29341.1 hypothetical protein GCM10007989_26150 [Devosia pacifica]
MSGAVPPIGTLTDRIELFTKVTSRNASGGQETIFVPNGSVWARVRSLRGRRTSHLDGRAASISHSVVIRYRSDLRAGDRIVYRGRRLEVQGTEDLNGRRAYLGCSCVETRIVG